MIWYSRIGIRPCVLGGRLAAGSLAAGSLAAGSLAAGWRGTAGARWLAAGAVVASASAQHINVLSITTRDGRRVSGDTGARSAPAASRVSRRGRWVLPEHIPER